MSFVAWSSWGCRLREEVEVLDSKTGPGGGRCGNGWEPQINVISTKILLALYAREREIALAWQENLAPLAFLY